MAVNAYTVSYTWYTDAHDKSSPKQKLQVCKQQQTASGNVNLFMPITHLVYFAFSKMYAIFSTGVMPQIYFLFISYSACECGKKGKETSK